MMYNEYIERLRDNFHIMLCMSPIGSTHRLKPNRGRVLTPLACSIFGANPDSLPYRQHDHFPRVEALTAQAPENVARPLQVQTFQHQILL